MESPFISIIVPAYNAERTMKMCIESLLNLDYPKNRYEIIIVDNNSKDNTADIIRQYPVLYLLEDQIQTSYASRNRAIKHAKGDILAFTDSDCIADSNWLKEGVKSFEDGEVVGLGGNVLSYKPEHYIEKYQDRKKVFDRTNAMSKEALKAGKANVITANAIYRRDLFSEVGLFKNEITGGGDREFSLRVQQDHKGKLVYNPDAIIYHKHRTTLFSFCEQYYRYGHNAYQQYDPFKMEKSRQLGYIKPVYWQMCSTFQSIISVVKSFFRYLFRRREEDKLRLIDSFLSGIRDCATFWGQFKCSLHNKQGCFFVFLEPKSLQK